LNCLVAQDKVVIEAIKAALAADGRYALRPQGIKLQHIPPASAKVISKGKA
jgi:hypothetical protein